MIVVLGVCVSGGGQCLTCTVRLDEAQWGPRSEYEDSKLPSKGWKDGKYRLACQTLVGNSDATLTLRPNKPGK
jgi:ferredoxin